MTVEAAVAKLMVGLARYADHGELRRYIEGDVVGERIPEARSRRHLP